MHVVALRFSTAISILLLALVSVAGCPQQQKIGRLSLIVTGNVEGYLRNCGCSAGQAGGELRKARIVKMEREEAQKPKPTDKGYAPGFLLLDLGNFSNSRTKVTRAETVGVVKSMAKLDYDAVGLGRFELLYPQADLLELIGSAGLPLTAANLQFTAPGKGVDHSSELNALLKPYRVLELKSGYKVGIIHVVDQSVQSRVGNDKGFKLSDPAAAAAKILEQHSKEAATWLLTISNATSSQESRNKLAQIKGIGLVIGSVAASAMEDTQTAVTALPRFVAPPFERAKDLVRVTVGYSSAAEIETVQVENIMIPDTVKPDEYVQTLVDEIEPVLERLANEDAEKQDQPGVHPRYIGSTACSACHPKIVEQLSSSKHTHAYDTLVEKDQQRSAACLPCHVVGFNQAGGWNILKNAERPEMRGVQCESCHGPGEYHQALMTGEKAPADLSANGRNAKGLLTASQKTCIQCHDSPNSPNFSFDTYWPQIKHSK